MFRKIDVFKRKSSSVFVFRTFNNSLNHWHWPKKKYHEYKKTKNSNTRKIQKKKEMTNDKKNDKLWTKVNRQTNWLKKPVSELTPHNRSFVTDIHYKHLN